METIILEISKHKGLKTLLEVDSITLISLRMEILQKCCIEMLLGILKCKGPYLMGVSTSLLSSIVTTKIQMKMRMSTSRHKLL